MPSYRWSSTNLTWTLQLSITGFVWTVEIENTRTGGEISLFFIVLKEFFSVLLSRPRVEVFLLQSYQFQVAATSKTFWGTRLNTLWKHKKDLSLVWFVGRWSLRIDLFDAVSMCIGCMTGARQAIAFVNNNHFLASSLRLSFLKVSRFCVHVRKALRRTCNKSRCRQSIPRQISISSMQAFRLLYLRRYERHS